MFKMGMRRLATVVLMMSCTGLIGLGALPAPVVARTLAEPVTLGGLNVIAGSETAGMKVRIPRSVDLPKEFFDNPAISIEGDGRIAGLVLVKIGEPVQRAYQLISTRWDFCGSPGCRGQWRWPVITHGINWEGRQGFRVPAGDYHLYLVADSTPVRVTLELDGLDGETNLHPTGDITNRIASPQPSSATPSQVFLGFGPKVSMPEPGLLMDGDSVESGPGAHTEGSCYWKAADDEGPERSTPGPHCIAFRERGGNGAGFATLGGGASSIGTTLVGRGTWHSSYWSTIASPEGSSQFLALWLSYEEPLN